MKVATKILRLMAREDRPKNKWQIKNLINGSYSQVYKVVKKLLD